MKKITNGQSVIWNDPDGKTSGKYRILNTYTERNKDITEDDIMEFDDRVLLIGNGSSEAEVYAQELDIIETKVIFRKFRKGGDVLALFPEHTDRRKFTVSSYAHLGQHCDVDYDAIISATVPAKEKDYAELLSELKSI